PSALPEARQMVRVMRVTGSGKGGLRTDRSNSKLVSAPVRDKLRGGCAKLFRSVSGHFELELRQGGVRTRMKLHPVFGAALALCVLAGSGGVRAGGEADQGPCTQDAMLVFDASGSMAGNVTQGIGKTIPRINEVRAALARVLPSITRFRRVGLITYGPGPYQQCNVQLAL